MNVVEELAMLRAKWAAEGTPKDAGSQIVKALSRGMTFEKEPLGCHTPNEGEWCEVCGMPKAYHEAMSPNCRGLDDG